MTHITHEQQDEIRALLVGRTVRKVSDEDLLLDDGRALKLVGNYGCGGCANGHYGLVELNDCPTNAIMAVEFESEDLEPEDPGGRQAYRIFVLAQDRRIKLAEFDGTDGNGWYGTGYWIEVSA